jgi:hypothetical protein
LNVVDIPMTEQRRIVGRALRQQFGGGRSISLEEAASFLAPAAIRLEEVHAEHPYHFVSDAPGYSGRHAVSNDRRTRGMYPSDVLEVLFGKRHVHGIGDVGALVRVLQESH